MNLFDMFDYANSTSWQDTTSPEEIIKISTQFCQSIINSCTRTKKLQRICGQSGSGKTTQVNCAIQHNYQTLSLNPAHIAVRTFYMMHPKYNELLKEFGHELIREKTNGFALKCLCAALCQLISKGVLIVLEIALLDYKFEQFISQLTAQYNYEYNYHLLAVSPKLSNYFISKRQESLYGLEGGRVIYKTSSDYFNKKLPKTFKKLTKIYPRHNVIMWDAHTITPIYFGKMNGSLKSFYKARKQTFSLKLSEQLLLESKINFYKKNSSLLI